MSKFKIGQRVSFGEDEEIGVVDFVDHKDLQVPYLLSLDGGGWTWAEESELEAI